MVIALEGASGVGKGAIAQELSRLTNWPVYRPFRPQVDSHQPGEDDPRLAALQDVLPVNTWAEDLYTADVLSVTRPDVILDRSMPSGLAHNRSLPPAQRMAAVMLWAERMRKAEGCLILLEATEEMRKARGARTDGWEPPAVREWCEMASKSGLQVLVIDTTPTAAQLAHAIYKRFILGDHTQAFIRNIEPRRAG